MRKIAPALAVLAFLACVPATQAATLYSCPLSGGGDRVDRGFYVTSYPGSTLDTVTLTYIPGSGNGAYTVTLTPRLNTYDGPIIGGTQTQIVNITGPAVTTTFNFANAPVPFGSTVTFSQVLVSGPGAPPVLFYDTGTGPCPNITETNGTSPPLDTFRRDSIGVTITGSNVIPPPIPVSTAPIPTLSEYALALLAGLLVLIGVSVARRRR